MLKKNYAYKKKSGEKVKDAFTRYEHPQSG